MDIKLLLGAVFAIALLALILVTVLKKRKPKAPTAAPTNPLVQGIGDTKQVPPQNMPPPIANTSPQAATTDANLDQNLQASSGIPNEGMMANPTPDPNVTTAMPVAEETPTSAQPIETNTQTDANIQGNQTPSLKSRPLNNDIGSSAGKENQDNATITTQPAATTTSDSALQNDPALSSPPDMQQAEPAAPTVDQITPSPLPIEETKTDPVVQDGQATPSAKPMEQTTTPLTAEPVLENADTLPTQPQAPAPEATPGNDQAAPATVTPPRPEAQTPEQKPETPPAPPPV